ncbi:Chromosome (plasmid) partitioning protein ParA [Hyphomicrobiales bacterium]|nr:Chromosome (plasmid) partitioning protein ParA [Hyphomicrobiales bacterium]CAH1671649.1 Chromosome (plasmid) partitioning protein ParA [Hyphomicrobiales bacterium]
MAMEGRIITLAQQKGGSGKTTLAAHLAVAFARLGRAVAILDVDPQGSLGQWFERRETHFGPDAIDISFGTASGWGARREARGFARNHDIVIVDTPPKSDVESRSAIEAADLVVVPVQPTQIDLWATDPTLQNIAREGTPSLIVLNRVVQRAGLTGEMIEAIQALGRDTAATSLGNRVAFAASIGRGLSVQEIEPAGKGAQEIAALTGEIHQRLTST